MALNRRLKVPEHVLSRDLEGEVVLLNLDTGAYFSLDEVGSRIWALLQEGRDFEAIRQTVQREYAVSAEQLESDLLDLAHELLERGLVEEVDDAVQDSSSASP